MIRRNGSPTGSALVYPRLPLFLFFFLAVVFFLCQHDLFFTTNVTQGYSFSVEHVVSALDTGSLNRQIGLAALGIFAITSLIRSRGFHLQIDGPLGWSVLLYAGLALSSLFWADDTLLTLRRLMVFATLCVAGIVIARRFSLRQVVQWTFLTTALYLLVGVLAEISLGTFRPFTSGYRFAGTLHPNHQGINCVLLILSGLAATDMQKHRKAAYRVCILIGVVFLILTGSRTAFAAGILAVTVYFGMTVPKQTRLFAALATLLVGIALWIPFALSGGTSVPNVESVFMLGRQATKVQSFNGRSRIWNNITPYIDSRPLLGYGYGGFWTVNHITELTEATENSGVNSFGVAESHDAYLDCLLDLGFVGLAVFVSMLVGGIARSFSLYRISPSPALAFTAAFLVFCLANGLLESAIVSSIFLTFLLLTVFIVLGFRSRIRVLGDM